MKKTLTLLSRVTNLRHTSMRHELVTMTSMIRNVNIIIKKTLPFLDKVTKYRHTSTINNINLIVKKLPSNGITNLRHTSVHHRLVTKTSAIKMST